MMRRSLLIPAIALAFVAGSLSAADQVASATIWLMNESVLSDPSSVTVLGHPLASKEPEIQAIHFNGATDGLLFASNPLAGQSKFTIEVLFRPEAGGLSEQRFLHAQDEPANRALMEIRLLGENWALDTFLYSTKTESKCALLDNTKLHPINRWTWVALVYENGHMAHYIDGIKELEGEVNFAPMLSGQVSVGVRQNKVYWFKGAIREVRFHPTALSGEKLQHSATK